LQEKVLCGEASGLTSGGPASFLVGASRSNLSHGVEVLSSPVQLHFFFLTLDQLQKFGLLTPVLPHPVLAPFLTLLEVAEEMAAQGLCYCASRA
jgi:hypothetical protein